MAYVLLALIHYTCTVNPVLIQVNVFLVMVSFKCSDGCAVNSVEVQVNVKVRLLLLHVCNSRKA